MGNELPIEELPAVWADLNAQGWEGNGDLAFYVLDPVALAAAHPVAGKCVFLWDHEEPATILGWVAALEYVSIGHFTGWRAVPVPGSFYRGPRPPFVPSGVGA